MSELQFRGIARKVAERAQMVINSSNPQKDVPNWVDVGDGGVIRPALPPGDGPLALPLTALLLVTALAIVGPWVGAVFGVAHGLRDAIDEWLAPTWLLLLAVVMWRARTHMGSIWLRLFRTDAQFADLAATTREWTWETDTRFVIVSCGPAVVRLLGRSPVEMVGRSMFDFIDEADVPRARSMLATALESGGGWEDVELSWRHADGHRLVMVGNAVPVRGSRGDIVGFRGARSVVSTQRLTPALVDAARHIQQIIENQSLEVALQPVIDLTTHEWVSAEALARFTDGSQPGTVFPMAEEIGRGADLELLALRRALDALSALPEGVSLSVNASPAFVLDPRFSRAMTTSGLDLSRLILEITEHSAVTSYPALTAVLDPLRAKGLRLAVDDTGAGYASFHHVLNLRPDIIKIDRSLIIDIDHDLARRSFVTAIMLLALDLGAAVTAEGIERREELDALATLGVDHAQGYLICRPSTDTSQWETWRYTDWVSSTHAVA